MSVSWSIMGCILTSERAEQRQLLQPSSWACKPVYQWLTVTLRSHYSGKGDLHPSVYVCVWMCFLLSIPPVRTETTNCRGLSVNLSGSKFSHGSWNDSPCLFVTRPFYFLVPRERWFWSDRGIHHRTQQTVPWQLTKAQNSWIRCKARSFFFNQIKPILTWIEIIHWRRMKVSRWGKSLRVSAENNQFPFFLCHTTHS